MSDTILVADDARNHDQPDPCQVCGKHPSEHEWMTPIPCPFCGQADQVFETDCWGHPFGSYTCRRCGAYSVNFTREEWWDMRDPEVHRSGRMPNPEPTQLETWSLVQWGSTYPPTWEQTEAVCWMAGTRLSA